MLYQQHGCYLQVLMSEERTETKEYVQKPVRFDTAITLFFVVKKQLLTHAQSHPSMHFPVRKETSDNLPDQSLHLQIPDDLSICPYQL
jgi:hypothetical protein